MPVSRISLFGCSGAKSCICCSTSGEALNSTQLMPSLLTQIDDCVRLVALIVPLRIPSQLKQLQFHCGNPPPAPAPNTCICMKLYDSLKNLFKIQVFYKKRLSCGSLFL